MDNSKTNFFLIISPEHFELHVINEKSEILFKELFFLNDLILEDNFYELKNFLDKNIFKLEKKLNLYIKEINLIIEHKNFINIDVSLIKELKNLPKHYNSSHILSNIRDSVLITNNNYQLIHMTINNFIFDKKHYPIQSEHHHLKNFFLEIRLICLKKNTLKSCREILTRYQISVKSIFNLEYVKSFRANENDHLSVTANKLINGLNPNEIRFSRKHSKNFGFFEKFFKLFS